jgi:thioredoxin reductase
VEETAVSAADVVIVGAGPAGLSAAIELRRRGAGRVVVYERELQAGGVPRHTAHLGYGMRDLHRVTTGPRYAARLTRTAERAGVEIEVGRTVHSCADGSVTTMGAAGPTTVQAGAVMLATGVRERPRAARLVPGDRPAGVLTTGALQQFAALHHQRVGTRAVIVGAEHVSFSAVLTLAHGGCTVAAMVTPLPRHQTYAPLRVATAARHHVPIHTGVAVAEIVGGARVEAVVLSDGRRIECDTVVFTGDWVPDHELARLSGLHCPASPVVDSGGHTERRGVFAIGNLTHPAETAGVCALDGRRGHSRDGLAHAAARPASVLRSPSNRSCGRRTPQAASPCASPSSSRAASNAEPATRSSTAPSTASGPPTGRFICQW